METTEICSGVDYRFPWLLNAQKTQWTGIFSWPFEWSMMMTNFIESPCRRTVILKQMAEVGNAVVYKTARRNVSAINFGWMPNASFKRRKKGCQITQYGFCLALLDETYSHELIAWCEMHSGSNLCKIYLVSNFLFFFPWAYFLSCFFYSLLSLFSWAFFFLSFFFFLK